MQYGAVYAVYRFRHLTLSKLCTRCTHCPQVFLGSPLKLWASVGHWWIWHFDLAKYTEKQKPRVSGTPVLLLLLLCVWLSEGKSRSARCCCCLVVGSW